jgi:S-adenosylmethionine:tRNA-ribosyltransferase-isomerase (queuine synthetase)
MIKEIRRVDYKHGERYRTKILDAKKDLILADTKAQQFDLDLHKKVSEGMELAFMDDVIIQLAQNFIKIVLAPVYDNIIFDNTDPAGALPLMDYLAKELNENNEEKYKSLQIKEEVILNFNLLEKAPAGTELETDSQFAQ